jgi:ribosomal protein S9
MQNTLASNAAKLTSEQAEARTKVLDLNSGALQKYSQLKPEEQAAAWPQVAAQLNQNEPGAYDPATPLAGNQLQLALGAHNLESKMVAQRAEEAKTAQSNAEAAKLNTERAISERRLAALKDPNTLATLEKQIDASIPLAKGGIYAQQNAVAKQAVAGALATNSEHSLEDAQKAIKDSVDLIGRHDTSIDVAKTELPGKFAEAQALANVHGEIAKAEAGRGLYMKSAEDYSKAQEAAKEMSDVIDLARSGNKVAYAYAPVTGVLTINSANGVKRVNMAEIGKYSGAGNLADRIEGYLGKAISGASIPPQILNDMQQLHQKMLQGPLEKHVRDTNTINQTYNTKFTPQGSSSSQPSGPFKVGDNYNGHKILSVTKVE